MNPTKDYISRIPRLRVEHVESQPLILHTQIEKARIAGPNDPLMKRVNPQSVGSCESEILAHEREMVQIPGAHNDSINLCGLTILECACPSIDFRQEWNCFEIIWPMEAHRPCSPRKSQRLSTKLVALRSNVLSRIRCSNNKNVLTFKFFRVPIVMPM